MFPNSMDKSTGAKTTTTNAAVFIAASMSNCGETVAFKTSAPAAMIEPIISAPNDNGLPFNPNVFICILPPP
jgi:hypothetical protein